MRVLFYNKYSEKHLTVKTIKENIIKNNPYNFIDEFSDVEEIEIAMETRKYSLIILDKDFNFNFFNKKNINFFYTNIILIDKSFNQEERISFYKKGVNQIIDLNAYSHEENLLQFFSNKNIDKFNYIQIYNIKIDLNKKEIYLNSKLEKSIKGKLFEIFLFFITNINITFSKEDVINSVFEDIEIVNENSVDTYLSTLKKVINSKFDKLKMNIINKEGYCLLDVSEKNNIKLKVNK